MKTKLKTSPVIQLLDHVYEHALKAKPRSWQRVNYAMHRALEIAIGSLFEFHADDWSKIVNGYNSGYWLGDDIERWYSLCVADGNDSGRDSFEKLRGRESLIADSVEPVKSHFAHVTGRRQKERLHVGAKFDWYGYRVTVTSFKADGSCTACAYPPNKYVQDVPTAPVAKAMKVVKTAGYEFIPKWDFDQRKPIKRFVITRDGIIEERADRKRRSEIEKTVVDWSSKQRGDFMVAIGNPKDREAFLRTPLKKLEQAFTKFGATP